MAQCYMQYSETKQSNVHLVSSVNLNIGHNTFNVLCNVFWEFNLMPCLFHKLQIQWCCSTMFPWRFCKMKVLIHEKQLKQRSWIQNRNIWKIYYFQNNNLISTFDYQTLAEHFYMFYYILKVFLICVICFFDVLSYLIFLCLYFFQTPNKENTEETFAKNHKNNRKE